MFSVCFGEDVLTGAFIAFLQWLLFSGTDNGLLVLQSGVVCLLTVGSYKLQRVTVV